MTDITLLEFRKRFPAKPYDLVWHEGETWEAISFPWPNMITSSWKPEDGAGINIRKRGDPTTMIAVDAAEIELVSPVTAGCEVVCRTCRRRYVLCPKDDYYGASHDHDGQCEKCMVTDLTKGQSAEAIAINPEVGEAMQKKFESRNE